MNYVSKIRALQVDDILDLSESEQLEDEMQELVLAMRVWLLQKQPPQLSPEQVVLSH